VFRVYGLGFKIESIGLRFTGSGFVVAGVRLRVQDLCFKVQG
jgi:hypothetical protein